MEKHPEKFPPEKPEVMPQGKKCKPNSAQILIDLGSLLPSVAVAIPRMYPVTYLDLRSQLGAEQVRLTMSQVEEHARCMIHVASLDAMMLLMTKFERLRRWTALVEDRRLRLAL